MATDDLKSEKTSMSLQEQKKESLITFNLTKSYTSTVTQSTEAIAKMNLQVCAAIYIPILSAGNKPLEDFFLAQHIFKSYIPFFMRI